MPRKRGNPAWGRGESFQKVPPVAATDFELQVARLGLCREDYYFSDELRAWCQNNCDRCYVPEWLLKRWGIQVDPNAA